MSGDRVQTGINDSINHAYKKEPPQNNLSISKPSGVFCLANTSMCWEDEAPIPLGKGTEALYLGPSQTSLCLFIELFLICNLYNKTVIINKVLS